MASVSMIVRCRGRNGYGKRDAYGDREQRRPHRLGEEEVRDPLDVGGDPPAFGDHPGRVAKLPSSSTSSATALVAGAPEPIAMPMSASLRRKHIVDAVAGHRDRVPARLQRPTIACF